MVLQIIKYYDNFQNNYTISKFKSRNYNNRERFAYMILYSSVQSYLVILQLLPNCERSAFTIGNIKFCFKLCKIRHTAFQFS